MWLTALLLAIALAAVAWFAYPRGPALRSHGRWLRHATIAFALPALVGLALLGRLEALVVVPAEFAPLVRLLPVFQPAALLPALGAGLVVGTATVAAQIAWARRRGRPVSWHIVSPAPLAARSRRELVPATVTALAAGITEELAFRLFIPLTATMVTGSAWIGFALATAVFVALHRYQRWWGLVGVALTAVALAALWLMSGALWLAMLVHAMIDVMALAVRPWLAGFRR